MNTLFTDQVTIADDLIDGYMATFVRDIEVRPVLIEDEVATEVDEDRANAFAVYYRYDDKAVDAMNILPSQWIADFGTRQSAESFAKIIKTFIKI